MVGPVSSRPTVTSPRITSDNDVKQAAAKKTEGQDGAATPSAKKPMAEIPGDTSGTAKKAAEASPAVKGGAGSAPAPSAGDLRPKKKSKGVEADEMKVTVGGNQKAEAKDPVERAMVNDITPTPQAPGRMDIGSSGQPHSPAEVAAGGATASWSMALGETKPTPGTPEFKAANDVHTAAKRYTTAQKDYNDTVQIKGQAVLTQLDAAKSSGALKKMDDAFDGSPVMKTLQEYQKVTREADIAYKNLTGVATPEAKAASESVGAAEEKLKQLKLGDLKADAEKNKAELADKIAKVKGWVDQGMDVGKAMLDAGLSLSAKPLVDYAMKQLDSITGDIKGKAEDAIKGKVTEMLAGPEMKQMAETEAQIQAYDKAIKNSKYKGAEKELGAAKSALEAKMGALETARDTYVSKRTEQGEAVDQLKSLEDEYNKANPGKKSHVFEKLQDYHSTIAEKSQNLAEASAGFQQMLQKPPFAAAGGGIPDSKDVMRKAEGLMEYYDKSYTGADKEQKYAEAAALRDYAKSMDDWATKEGGAAKGISTAMGRGDQFAVVDSAVKDSLAAMGGKADKSKVEVPR